MDALFRRVEELEMVAIYIPDTLRDLYTAIPEPGIVAAPFSSLYYYGSKIYLEAKRTTHVAGFGSG